MQKWMPTVLPAKPLVVDPDPALAELLEAIRKGGREAYRRLLEVLRELKRLESGTPLFRQALAELSRAQGVVLDRTSAEVEHTSSIERACEQGFCRFRRVRPVCLQTAA